MSKYSFVAFLHTEAQKTGLNQRRIRYWGEGLRVCSQIVMDASDRACSISNGRSDAFGSAGATITGDKDARIRRLKGKREAIFLPGFVLRHFGASQHKSFVVPGNVSCQEIGTRCSAI